MDRTLRGLVAGIAAGILKNLWNIFDYYFLHLTHLRFLDWAAVLVTWAKPIDTFTTIFFLLIQLNWDGLLGILFAHFVASSITSRGVIIKSCFFSLMCWFVFKVIVNFYRVPFLSRSQPTPGAMSNVFGVILWGIALGFILWRLDKLGEKSTH